MDKKSKNGNTMIHQVAVNLFYFIHRKRKQKERKACSSVLYLEFSVLYLEYH
jgi:heme/copper-type cytochrome/quinol oxidase subunit 4